MVRPVRLVLLCAATAWGFGLALAPPALATSPGDLAEPAGCGHWQIVESPDIEAAGSALSSVAAIAADDVWAVGTAGGFSDEAPVAEHWDGVNWSVVKTPNPRHFSTDSNALNAVAAVSTTNVWAVGAHFDNGHSALSPLIEHWDGQRWHVVDNPSGHLSGAFFRGVTAVAADDVWAVGQRVSRRTGERNPLVAHWDGTSWLVVRVPNPRSQLSELLLSVNASSGDDIWAVGLTHTRYEPGSAIATRGETASPLGPFTMHFDGSVWKVVRSPDRDPNATLSGVVAIAGSDVWAVGSNGLPFTTLAEHWNGTEWVIADTADRPQYDGLVGVTAASADDVWAVGSNQTASGDSRTLVEHFDGAAWALDASPSPGAGDRLLGVATADGQTWAVGATATTPSAPARVLVEHTC